MRKSPQCPYCYEGIVVKKTLYKDVVFLCDRCKNEVEIIEFSESYKRRNSFT